MRLAKIIDFLEKDQLPYDEKRALKIAFQVYLFTINHETLRYINSKQKHMKKWQFQVIFGNRSPNGTIHVVSQDTSLERPVEH